MFYNEFREMFLLDLLIKNKQDCVSDSLCHSLTESAVRVQTSYGVKGRSFFSHQENLGEV